MVLAVILLLAFPAGAARLVDHGWVILTLLFGAFLYLSARVVGDDVGRATGIHMVVAGVLALCFGLRVLVPIFEHVRLYGLDTYALRYIGNDVDVVHVIVFGLFAAWFAIARAHGARS